jgi:GntR family transcriptional regulator
MARVERDPRPRAEQIASELRSLIMAGDLQPGSKLPSTAALIREYSTVSQTVQNALAMLKAEGYAEGKTGSGVFVRERAQQAIVPAHYLAPAGPGDAYPWITEAARRGQRGDTKLITVREAVPPAQVAEAFGVESSASVILRTQLMSLDDEPAELVRSYYPMDIARGTALTEKRRIKGGSPRLLAELGFRAREFVDHVSTRPPTSDEYVLLQLPDGVPILRTFRVVYADERRPVEATVMIKAGHLYELQYRSQID